MSLLPSRSAVLRSAQVLLLKTRLIYAITPFAGTLQKLYCLRNFSKWKSDSYNHSAAKGYTDRYKLYTEIILREQLTRFHYFEFGVSKGESINWWLYKNTDPESRFYGFDSFDGIPENWGTVKKGSYTNEGNIPRVNDQRCSFIKGTFQQTLASFLKTYAPGERMVLHFDADLYSSTLFCLCLMAGLLKRGDILIFDQFDITTHEFRAFDDFQSAFNIPCEWIGESNNYRKIVFKIK